MTVQLHLLPILKLADPYQGYADADWSLIAGKNDLDIAQLDADALFDDQVFLPMLETPFDRSYWNRIESAAAAVASGTRELGLKPFKMEPEPKVPRTPMPTLTTSQKRMSLGLLDVKKQRPGKANRAPSLNRPPDTATSSVNITTSAVAAAANRNSSFRATIRDFLDKIRHKKEHRRRLSLVDVSLPGYIRRQLGGEAQAGRVTPGETAGAMGDHVDENYFERQRGTLGDRGSLGSQQRQRGLEGNRQGPFLEPGQNAHHHPNAHQSQPSSQKPSNGTHEHVLANERRQESPAEMAGGGEETKRKPESTRVEQEGRSGASTPGRSRLDNLLANSQSVYGGHQNNSEVSSDSITSENREYILPAQFTRYMRALETPVREEEEEEEEEDEELVAVQSDEFLFK